jgi:hypothetical protein
VNAMDVEETLKVAVARLGVAELRINRCTCIFACHDIKSTSAMNSHSGLI